MIKAEAITHEGNPGPNWLDHCKNMITPGKVVLVVVVASVLIGGIAIKNRSNDAPATANTQPSTSQQSEQVPLAPSESLQVEPLNSSAATQQTTTDLQSTNTDQNTATPSVNTNSPQSSSSTPKGKSLSGKSQGQGSSHANQNSAVHQSLQGVQQSVQQSVQDTTNSLKSTLQGLGLQ